MQVLKTREGSKLTLHPVGRIDTITSPELEAEVKLDGVEELVFDLSDVEYISSAGLRVLLASQKKMAGKSMKIASPQAAVKKVFDLTGFTGIFTFI